MSNILSNENEIMVTAHQIMDSLREMFGQPSIQIKQEANVAHSRRFASSSSGSEKIHKRKEGKGKGPTIVVDEHCKRKTKVVIKGKCFHCNVDEHWKTNCPKYLVKKKEKEEISSFKQLEESEMTPKVGTRDVISARAVGDAKLSHVNLDRIGRLVKNGLLNKLEDDSLPPCESCLEGKMTKRPFTGKGYRAKEPLKLIHSDLCGPMNVKARGGFEYFISFIDDYSRILLSIDTFYDYEIWQMDVKTAFLNDNLEESIFMSQPEEFITQSQEQKVCKLNRSIYGLKQASRSWNVRHGVHLSKEQCPKTPQEVEDMRRISYASAVGSLMYVMLCTWPDICYAVGIVSRYQSNPGLNYWTAVKIILKYLKRTRDYMLVYRAKDLILTGYIDSDFQTDKDSRKSTSRLVFTLNEEVIWAIANSKEPRSHKRGKHIERKYHLIREIVQRGDVIVTKIASEHNIADPFLKTLTTKVFEGHLESIGLRDMYIR
ncbi:gag/pol protein [Cucumis melo var. makuwa]|uniref:Gag/pol protein n=1 Tax=Cucumis melo var. makuwa TaxID=1194695 RepID=A0A5A7V3R3_CUCMM|nr:gag/pol protein [Cucumis melo var. makuwa]TYK22139.1 gag/pol protein [Cucumis melo var. makuwa]